MKKVLEVLVLVAVVLGSLLLGFPPVPVVMSERS